MYRLTIHHKDGTTRQALACGPEAAGSAAWNLSRLPDVHHVICEPWHGVPCAS